MSDINKDSEIPYSSKEGESTTSLDLVEGKEEKKTSSLLDFDSKDESIVEKLKGGVDSTGEEAKEIASTVEGDKLVTYTEKVDVATKEEAETIPKTTTQEPVKKGGKIEARCITALPPQVRKGEMFVLEYEVVNKTFRPYSPVFGLLFANDKRVGITANLFTILRKKVIMRFRVRPQEAGTITFLAQFGFNPLWIQDEVITRVEVV